MSVYLYQVLDGFFMVSHLALIIFVVFGWIWKSTRPWNLFAILVVMFSWFVLGLFQGIGYCLITDWHWQVLAKLNKTVLQDSYLNYLIYKVTGLHISSQLIDNISTVGIFIALIVSMGMNIRDRKKSQEVSVCEIQVQTTGVRERK